jgi:hypothetical protein
MTRVAGSATNRAGEEGGLGGGGECRGGEEREGRKWKEGECCEERQVRGGDQRSAINATERFTAGFGGVHTRSPETSMIS